MNDRALHTTLSFFFIVFLLISCATAPEFERNNPFDVDLELISLPDSLYPTSPSYKFTSEGLRLKVNRDIFRYVIIERRNGSDTFEEIFNGRMSFCCIFVDSTIKSKQDLGYPLIYRFTEKNNAGGLTGSKQSISIDFGGIDSLEFYEAENAFIVSWKNDTYLNDGFILSQNNSENRTYIETINGLRTEIPVTLFNESEEFYLEPYKIYNDTTVLEGVTFKLKQKAPDQFNIELLTLGSFELTWEDNSILETGYRLKNLNTSDVIDLPANTSSYIIESNLQPNQTLKYSISSLIGDKESEVAIATLSLNELPGPEIKRILQISKQSFEIHFSDEVSFSREVQFSLSNGSSFQTSNADTSILITTQNSSPGLGDRIQVTMSTPFSPTRSFIVQYMSTMNLVENFELESDKNHKTIDLSSTRTLVSDGNIVRIYTLPNFTLNHTLELNNEPEVLRLFEDSDLLFVSDVTDKRYLINYSTQDIETIDNDFETVYDADVVHNDSKVVLSTNQGVLVYDLDTKMLSRLQNFPNNSELQFFGTPDVTRLLALEKATGQVHYFNTIADFSFKSSVDPLQGCGIGSGININNIGHNSTGNNALGLNNGRIVKYSINVIENFSIGVCNDIYLRTSGQNNFVELFSLKYMIVASENNIRLIDTTDPSSSSSLKSIDIENSQIKHLSINRDSYLESVNNEFVLELRTINDINYLRFYELSPEWDLLR